MKTILITKSQSKTVGLKRTYNTRRNNTTIEPTITMTPIKENKTNKRQKKTATTEGHTTTRSDTNSEISFGDHND